MSDSTIIASIIGALVALVVSYINNRNSKKGEERLAHRKTIEKKYGMIGSLLYQVVAKSNTIIEKYSDGNETKEDKNKATKLTQTLDTYRLLSRYCLWGIDEGFRAIIRLPSYASRCNKRIDLGKQLIDDATKLRESLDDAIMDSYLRGDIPTPKHVNIVKERVKQLKNIYSAIDSPKQ